MHSKFTYSWFINQFENAKDKAEKFILSVDETEFLQPPESGRWCIAECYSHLINFGYLYYKNLADELPKASITTDDQNRAFPPRWIGQKIVTFFEPPVKVKVKTFNQMKPNPVISNNRKELLNDYVNLQEQFIALLEEARHRQIDLRKSKVPHPIYSWMKLTLSESFALVEAHQRRHQWQAEETAKTVGGRQ